MINRLINNRSIRITSRLVAVLTGFFVFLVSNGLPLLDLSFDESIFSFNKENENSVSDNDIYLHEIEGRQEAYTVKINEMVFSLKDLEQVVSLLSAAKERFDSLDEYDVVLVSDTTRKLPAITARLVKKTESDIVSPSDFDAGVARELDAIMELAGEGTLAGIEGLENGREAAKNSEDYNGTDASEQLELCELQFYDTIEITKTFIYPEDITLLDEAIDKITQEKQKEKIYEVQPGDTLSVIAMKNDISMDELVAINETLETQDSVIRAGDELTITIPQPELSLSRISREYFEENYNAPVQYVDNDDWYTTDTKVLQEPIAGYHRLVADVYYVNDEKQESQVLWEQVVMEPVAKIVERGTKVPPMYIKPISGGRMSSPFGKRAAPKKGASTYHKGIDWATPVGTAVVASSSGVVSRAGWGSGYGNVVYIDHPDGRQTRYGHLSKVLVKPGQHVNMGDKIALSGNTGRSTGPHIHFEIISGGGAINPLNLIK